MKNITVILTAYKRDYFDDQIDSIKSQENVNVDRIFIWQNGDYVDLSRFKGKVSLIKSDLNLKFHGRFTIPLLLETEYVAIFDDDTIPNKLWLENAIRCCEEHNCISGANGRWYNGDGTFTGIGDNGSVHSDTLVDLVGHSWVFKTEWIKYMWKDKTYTYDNAEDIQFCCSSKIFGGIPSYVPMQGGDTSSSRNFKLGVDEHATYKKSNHGQLRKETFEYWENKGYKRING